MKTDSGGDPPLSAFVAQDRQVFCPKLRMSIYKFATPKSLYYGKNNGKNRIVKEIQYSLAGLYDSMDIHTVCTGAYNAP